MGHSLLLEFDETGVLEVMRRVNQITGAVILAVALFLGYQAALLTYYTPLGPGPGFFPLWLCAILAMLAVAVLVQATLQGYEPLTTDFWPPRSSWLPIAAVVAALTAATTLMPVLGFRLTMLVFFLALLMLLGRRPLVETVILSVLGSFGSYHVFTNYLSQPLPVGVLGI